MHFVSNLGLKPFLPMKMSMSLVANSRWRGTNNENGSLRPFTMTMELLNRDDQWNPKAELEFVYHPLGGEMPKSVDSLLDVRSYIFPEYRIQPCPVLFPCMSAQMVGRTNKVNCACLAFFVLFCFRRFEFLSER